MALAGVRQLWPPVRGGRGLDWSAQPPRTLSHASLLPQVKKIHENEKRLEAGDHPVELLARDFEKNYNMYTSSLCTGSSGSWTSTPSMGKTPGPPDPGELLWLGSGVDSHGSALLGALDAVRKPPSGLCCSQP